MSGKGSTLGLKVLAVVFSVGLAGGYVGWRKHQADKEAEQAAKAATRKAEADNDRFLMVGSKNPGRKGFVTLEQLGLDGDDFGLREGEQLDSDGILLSGSKFGAIPIDAIEIPGIPLPDQPAGRRADNDPFEDSEEEPKLLLPSSKSISGILFKPKPAVEEEEEKQEP